MKQWLPLLTAVWRTAIAFFVCLAATRVLKKQYIAHQTYFDFTLGVTVGTLVAHIPNDYKEPFLPLVIPVVVMVALGVAVGWLAMRFERLRAMLQGEPTVLIQNGRILEDNMRRLRFNQDQLHSQLRAAGYFDIDSVEFAVLEPGGQLSVRPRSQYRALQPKDLHVPTGYEGIAIELIMDGSVVHKNLRENRLSEAWLFDRLHERGIADPHEVYFAVLNTRGELFIDRYDDRIKRPVDLEGLNPSTPPSPTLP